MQELLISINILVLISSDVFYSGHYQTPFIFLFHGKSQKKLNALFPILTFR